MVRQDFCGCKSSHTATNDDGTVDISDPLHLLSGIFLGGILPPRPGIRNCGTDPTADDLPPCEYPRDICDDVPVVDIPPFPFPVF